MTTLATGLVRGDGSAARLTVAATLLTVVAAVLASHLSVAAFVGAAVVLGIIVAYASLRWPRPVLVLVALSPIVDRYLAPGILDTRVEAFVHFLSEGLLFVAGVVLVAQAIRRRTLVAALWHRTTVFLLVFTGVAAVSAVVNAVSPAQAMAGILFTLDAVAFFLLARIVGFTDRQAIAAIGTFVALMLAAAVVAALQALLSPNLFGLYALQGRFGEIYRLASFFGDPNVFGALLSAALPFTLFAIRGQRSWIGTSLAVLASALLMLALLHSFSRGGWLGAAVGFGIIGLLVDRRSLLVGAAIAAAMFVVVSVMPRDLLVGNADQAPRPNIVDSTAGRVGTVNEGRDLRTLFLRNAAPIIREHPLVGVGPGRYGGAVADLFGTDVYAQYGTDALFTNPKQRTVDNFWLHLLVESGIIGFAAFAGAVGVALLEILRGLRRAAWQRRVLLAGIAAASLALVTNSVTTMLLESNSVAFIFWLMLGIGTVLVAAPPDLPAEEPLR